MIAAHESQPELGDKVTLVNTVPSVMAAALDAGALPASVRTVTLVGEPTSGGSGRAAAHRLPHSKLRVQLSTMASFRPDGVLFEGNGVEPDVAVAMSPGDLVGTSDTALKRALEWIGK